MPWTLRMTFYTMIFGFLPYLYIYMRLGTSLKTLLNLRKRSAFLIMTLVYFIFHLYPLFYRALTDEVIKKANEFGLPICRFEKKPNCYDEKE